MNQEEADALYFMSGVIADTPDPGDEPNREKLRHNKRKRRRKNKTRRRTQQSQRRKGK